MVVISWSLQSGCKLAPFQVSDLPHAFHSLFHGCSKCCLSNKHTRSSQIPSKSQLSWKTGKASSCLLPIQLADPYPLFEEPGQLWHLSLNPPRKPVLIPASLPAMTDRTPCLSSLLLLQSGQHIASKGGAPHFNPPCPMLLLANHRATHPKGSTASRPAQGSGRMVLTQGQLPGAHSGAAGPESLGMGKSKAQNPAF